MKNDKAYFNKRASATSAIEIEAFFTTFDSIEAKVNVTPSAASAQSRVYGLTCPEIPSAASATSAKTQICGRAGVADGALYTPLLTHALRAPACVSPTPGEIYAVRTVRTVRLSSRQPTDFEAARIPRGYDREPGLMDEAGHCNLCKAPRLAKFRGFGCPPGVCPVCWFRYGRAVALHTNNQTLEVAL